MCIFFLPPHCPFTNTTIEMLQNYINTSKDLEQDLLAHIEYHITEPSNSYIGYCLNYSRLSPPILCPNNGLGGIQIRHRPTSENPCGDLDDCEPCTALARYWQDRERARLETIRHQEFLITIAKLNEESSAGTRSSAFSSASSQVFEDDYEGSEVEEYMEPLFNEVWEKALAAKRVAMGSLTSGSTGGASRASVYSEEVERYERLGYEMAERPNNATYPVSLCACFTGKVVDKLCGVTRDRKLVGF